MKYIQKFKTISESSNEKLWSVIDTQDWIWRESKYGQDESFSSKEKQAIIDFLTNIHENTNGADSYGYVYRFIGNTIKIEMISDHGYGNQRIILLISKSPDDWFFIKESFLKYQGGKVLTWREVNYTNIFGIYGFESYYKCDSIEGFLGFIGEIFHFLNKEKN